MEEIEKYADILNLPRPVSQRHARMSMIDRGAQFAPFAALVGYDAVIRETARLTDAETELQESGKELLDQKLRMLVENPDMEASFLCFQPDARKQGGSFVSIAGRVKKFDPYTRKLVLADGREIELESIREIEGVEE